MLRMLRDQESSDSRAASKHGCAAGAEAGAGEQAWWGARADHEWGPGSVEVCRRNLDTPCAHGKQRPVCALFFGQLTVERCRANMIGRRKI